jgi:hypothetical protein
MALSDGHPEWPVRYEDDERAYLRRADAVLTALRRAKKPDIKAAVLADPDAVIIEYRLSPLVSEWVTYDKLMATLAAWAMIPSAGPPAVTLSKRVTRLGQEPAYCHRCEHGCASCDCTCAGGQPLH